MKWIRLVMLRHTFSHQFPRLRTIQAPPLASEITATHQTYWALRAKHRPRWNQTHDRPNDRSWSRRRMKTCRRTKSVGQLPEKVSTFLLLPGEGYCDVTGCHCNTGDNSWECSWISCVDRCLAFGATHDDPSMSSFDYCDLPLHNMSAGRDAGWWMPFFSSHPQRFQSSGLQTPW